MQSNTPKYYVYYKFFSGDEFSGESVTSGTVVEAESDKEAIQKLTTRVVKERKGEITQIYNVQNVTGLFQVISDSIDSEHNADDFTGTQKFNIGFNIAHFLYGNKRI